MRIIVRVKLKVMIYQLLQKLLSYNTHIPYYNTTLCLTMQPQKFNFTLFHYPIAHYIIVKWGTLHVIAKLQMQNYKKFTLRRKISKIHDEKLQV